MKLILSLFLLISINACTKYEVIYPNSSEQIDAKTIALISDTTVNGVWNGGGKVLRINDKVIHGTGTLQNWIIDAALTQTIFDTSLNLKNIKTYDGKFSTIWYGTKASNADNWWNIQKSINVCMDNHLWCVTPGLGKYKFSKTLEVSSISNNAYQFCAIHFSGDASYWDNGQGTTFQYTGLTSPAFNLQLNKGSVLDHFALFGLWKSPSGTDSAYFNLTEANYKDQSGNNLPDSYTGMAIDYRPPINGTTRSGSTGVHMNNLSLGGFGMALAFSQNGITQNNDAHGMDYIHFWDNKYCIVGCQAQEKGISIDHIYSWGSVYNIVNIGFFGAKQAGNYSFDVANIAGRPIEPIKMSVGHWFSSSFNKWFCESIGRVCNISTQMPITLNDCTFDLNYFYSKQRNVIISNSNYVSFTGCTIRYYDGIGGDIWVNNAASFNNCSFYFGKVVYK